MFNLITWPKKLAEDLSKLGCEVILIDSNSTYPPLLEWYEHCPYKIHRLKENWLSCAFFKTDIYDQYKDDRFFILTDPDLDISETPKDFIEVLKKGLENTDVPYLWKAGLSLSIKNLPVNDMTKRVIHHERVFWMDNRLNDYGFYVAPIVTTLAVYDRTKSSFYLNGTHWSDQFSRALRSPYPYTCKHIPWSLTKEDLTDELKYFIETTGWPGWLSKKIYKDL